MNAKPSRSDLLLAGFVAMNLAVACGDAAGDRPGGVMYVPPTTPPVPALTGTEQHASPDSLTAAGAAAPSQPTAASTPAPARSTPASTPPPASVPPPASATPATPPASTPATTATPATPGAGAPAANGGASPSGFNAGAGTLEADGKTISYHIPDGTGGKDWNAKDKPIRVQRGMTLRLVDDDKSTRSGGHWLHTNGQPCPHGLKAIGSGFDCVIGRNAPYGVVSGTFEHNVANGIGRIYIEVVNDSITAK
ncbi:MAG TPA: hypothetical protein VJV78_13500 [Polyangiales bacterium]|nr:hypothetical protein [Polyangiales bacterium]